MGRGASPCRAALCTPCCAAQSLPGGSASAAGAAPGLGGSGNHTTHKHQVAVNTVHASACQYMPAHTRTNCSRRGPSMARACSFLTATACSSREAAVSAPSGGLRSLKKLLILLLMIIIGGVSPLPGGAKAREGKGKKEKALARLQQARWQPLCKKGSGELRPVALQRSRPGGCCAAPKQLLTLGLVGQVTNPRFRPPPSPP